MTVAHPRVGGGTLAEVCSEKQTLEAPLALGGPPGGPGHFWFSIKVPPGTFLSAWEPSFLGTCSKFQVRIVR